MIAMKEPPITKLGEFSLLAKKIMEELCALPTDLWTAEQLHLKLERNTAIREVNAEGMRAALGMGSEDVMQLLDVDTDPVNEIAKNDLTVVVSETLDSINPREAKVLRLRFGVDCKEHTLEEIADLFHVSKERIRQIEVKALRKLKHPSRSDLLRQYYDPESIKPHKPKPIFKDMWEEARWHAEQERLNKEKET